ncbi:MAG TPA: mechanosensitive ion channel domain-containing protein [Balneolaceae bacterium]|nr:mechanosensitive ion channel domain-containing protein [Balneolaceae bacterium]
MNQSNTLNKLLQFNPSQPDTLGHSTMQQTVVEELTKYGLDLIGALVILIVGWALANLISRWLKQTLTNRKRVDDTLTPIIADIVKVVIIAITLIMVLNQFGVQTASLVALVGSVAIAIGLALQGTLSNIASGIMLLLHRPFNTGDAVNLNGSVGVIEKIGLFMTELHTYNGVYMTLPNSTVWGNKIQNYSRKDSRRIDLTYRIGREEDMDKAMKIIEEIAANDERILAEPELLIAIRNLSENSIDILVRPWTRPGDWWRTQLDMNKRVKERFDEAGITIPYPQRDVHLFDKTVQNGSLEKNKGE